LEFFVLIFYLFCYSCIKLNNSNGCRNYPLYVLEPMTNSRRCGTTTGTRLCYRGLAEMSYRIRFAVGCLQSTPRQSQLWLIGTPFPRSILFVLDDILTIVLIHCLCRWRPETHSFHLPCGEMTVTLEDTHKFLGVSVRGRPVIGHCRSDGWRDRVEAFLGTPLPPEAMGYRTTGVSIPWLR
jgi:hypothetical protein